MSAEPLPDTTLNVGVAAPRERRQAPPPEAMFRRRVSLRTALVELWRFREMLVTLAERDLRARYKQAILGFAWAIVTPVMLMIVFTVFFTKFAKVDSHGAPYALFAYLGLIPWTFFNSAVSIGGQSLTSNMPLVNKVYCPREVFPLAAMVVAAVDALLSVLVLVVLFPATGYAPHLTSLYTPILVAVEIVFATAITLLVSVVLVYLRDLRHALPLILQLALFATPVAYGIQSIGRSRSFVLLYAAVNPLSPVIDGFRKTVLFGGHPDWQAVGVAAVSSVVLLFVSFRLFKRLETGIADIA